MVRPPLQASIVEIEDLFGTVRHNRRRKYSPKATPQLTVFRPGWQFLHPDFGPRQKKWRCQIIPDGKSAKENHVQFVPDRVHRQIWPNSGFGPVRLPHGVS
jgi:hypothetical protein